MCHWAVQMIKNENNRRKGILVKYEPWSIKYGTVPLSTVLCGTRRESVNLRNKLSALIVQCTRDDCPLNNGINSRELLTVQFGAPVVVQEASHFERPQPVDNFHSWNIRMTKFNLTCSCVYFVVLWEWQFTSRTCITVMRDSVVEGNNIIWQHAPNFIYMGISCILSPLECCSCGRKSKPRPVEEHYKFRSCNYSISRHRCMLNIISVEFLFVFVFFFNRH